MTWEYKLNKVRNWIACTACKKERAIYSKIKLSRDERDYLKDHIEEDSFVCAESLVPPGTPCKTLLQKEVSVDRTKTCSDYMEAHYYKHASVVRCGFCFGPLT